MEEKLGKELEQMDTVMSGGTIEPVVEAPVAEEVIEPEVKAEEPKVEPEPVVLDPKDQEIADLRAKLAEKEVQPKVEVKVEPEVKAQIFDEQDFIAGQDLDEVMRDPKLLNKMLNNIYQKAVNDAKQLSTEGVLKSIPDIVKTNIEMNNNLKKLADQFYEENADLAGFKKVVAVVFEEIASKDPGKQYDEVIKLVAPEVRSRLGLQKEVVAKLKEVPKSAPKLPSRGSRPGGPSNKPSTDSLQDELAEMDRVMRG